MPELWKHERVLLTGRLIWGIGIGKATGFSGPDFDALGLALVITGTYLIWPTIAALALVVTGISATWLVAIALSLANNWDSCERRGGDS